MRRTMMPTAAIEMDYTSANLIKQTHPNPIFRATIAAFNARLLALADTAAPISVLEVGCGEGFVLKYLAEQRPLWRLAGCDLNAGAIAYARRQCSTWIELEEADIYRLPIPPAAFDLVICSEVLEHLADVPAALAELKRVSRGQVLITVPPAPVSWTRSSAWKAAPTTTSPSPSAWGSCWRASVPCFAGPGPDRTAKNSGLETLRRAQDRFLCSTS